MTPAALHTTAVIHGLFSWTALLASAAASWLTWKRLPRPKTAARKLVLAVAPLATALLTATGALGLLLHEPYQRRLRQRIFVQSPRIGWLFERKEHLAYGAILLSLCALTALIALELRTRRSRPSDQIQAYLQTTVVRAYTTSTFLALLAALASIIVSHYRSL